MNIASSVELCNPQPTLNVATPTLKFLGTVDYVTAWQAMQNFTANRTPETPDEIWLLQHPPTYTQGQAGLPEHLLNPHQIPVVQIDRGGQVTYHGPGQIVAYLLLDLRRWKLNVRQLVRIMEQAVIDILADYHIDAAGRIDAPGVYVGDAKIAALGLKIKHSCCYHGLSFNINMDMTPYAFINPCGYKGLRVTQLKDFGIDCPISDLETRIAQNLVLALQRHRDAEIAVSNAPRRDPDLEEKLKNYARELRANLTDAEQRVWHLLRDRHFLGYKFRRQHPMGNYILDFYCAEANLAIELDGGQHLENAAYDLQRTTVLQRDGMQVLRFWNNDVLNQTEAVLTQIATVLLLDKQAKSEILKTPLTPALSPLAGRGSKVG